ncbi:hypothetical protein Ahy_A03g015173 [Arachis hypogaea]|uniref:Transposase MuDR plant domain-containing protein n=1 Tax=Arachis hypogaea TaxID=3818 RepID=A0A445DZP2_ARAHY|nr:hypothetical protein Ahy_A03g015173 [Arachis hypogaea]
MKVRILEVMMLMIWDKFLVFRRNEDTPNSEDDDSFPVFREETRFGKLQLEVRMKFDTKMDFKEAMREYCIQKDRKVRFKKNDNDSEIVCWQVKTFNDDHTCPRETKNKLANKGKFPNLKHSEALTYFKSKCDLDLDKSSLTRAVGDVRHIVYGDAAAQYRMVRDYGETLLKSNPGSTVRITTIYHPNPVEESTFDKIYICLDGCKNGFRAGCRSLIGLNGAFQKIRFGRQILTVIYIIAYAIIPVENTNN